MASPALSNSEREELQSALHHEFWRRGMLRWKLHSSQQEVYDSIARCGDKRFVLEISRQWGKTWLLTTIAVETCLRTPGVRVVYGAPTLKHLAEFVLPTFYAITQDAPSECRGRWDQGKGHWVFPNGSYVHLFGADDRRKASRGRGPKAALVIFDECGFTPILMHVLDDIFKAQTLHSGGRTLLGSTPAEEPDHDFSTIAAIAETNGNYARRTVYDNPLLTPEVIEGFIQQGARDKGLTREEYIETDTFRREYLAERVINKLLVVVPEWEKARAKCVVDVPRPRFFNAQVVLDFGGVDPHAAQFGYWHFELAAYVVEDELLLHKGENTAELVQAIKAKETELYGTKLWDGTLRVTTEEATEELLANIPDWMADIVRKSSKRDSQPFARWCDNNIQLARDMYQLHQLALIPTAKDNKELQVNNVRVNISEHKILLHPRCVHSDRHLRTTTWKDHKRKDFARKNGEHGDLVDTLCYGQRNLDKRNPDTTPKTDIIGRTITGPVPSLLPDTRLGRRLRPKTS